MPTVETSIWIDAPSKTVYEIAKQTDRYPEYMKDVKSVTVIEREGSRVVSDWVGIVPNFLIKVRWRQEEIWNDEAMSSSFHQVQGDYDRMSGTWTFAEENGGTRFSQALDYEWNVPTLGPLVRKVIHSIVIKNLENVGEALKKRTESSTTA